MKNTAGTMLRNVGRVLGVLALCSFATVGTVFGGSITKTFEFGQGTGNLRSNVRTFPVPCSLAVEAKVTFQRHGPDSADSDVPIKIDLRKPDTGTDQEGPIAETESAFAKKGQQTLTLNSAETNRGCSRPWRVRVRHANDGTAPFAIYGSITVRFSDNTRNISVTGAPHTSYVFKGESETKNLGGSAGLEQGRIEITATWIHFVMGLHPIPGPNPVKLKFEIIDPSGIVVAGDEGYSNAEFNPCCSNDKMKVVFNVPECKSGQWKIKITNNHTIHDASNIETKATFKPDCPN